jgi:hypothetical protein
MNIYRVCSGCKQSKDISNFYKCASRKDGYEYHCKQCKSTRYEERYATKKLHILDLNKQYRLSTNFKHSKQWYQNNSEYFKKYSREWRLLHIEEQLIKGKCRRQSVTGRANRQAYDALRRANILLAAPGWVDIREIEMVYNIAIQLSIHQNKQFVVDHYYPLRGKTVCGLHVPGNLQVITNTENLNKSNKHPDDFYMLDD